MLARYYKDMYYFIKYLRLYIKNPFDLYYVYYLLNKRNFFSKLYLFLWLLNINTIKI